MNKVKKAAIISAMVLMISIVPAFALNETNTANETQDQNQTQTKTQTQTQNTSKTTDQTWQKNCNSQNCNNCDGDQHKYQYGKKNNSAGTNSGTCNGEPHKYQYGLKNGNADVNNCGEHKNCPKNQ